MNKKRNDIITIIIISFIILIFTVADFLNGNRLFSEKENRLLASKPELTLKSLFFEDYTKEYEAYVTDQFVARDEWITVKTYIDVFLQKKEINGVYLGADSYLMEQHLPENYSAAQEAEKLELLKGLTEEWGAKVMLIPTADNILTEKLPAYAPYYNQKRLLDRVKSEIGADNYIDVYTVLQEHADEEIYYRTDHHWTSLGAYYGFLAWAEGRDVHYSVGPLETVTEDFLGTLHSKLNIDVQADSIQYFPRTQSRPVTVTYDFKNTAETCYEESYLETKNKYGFFLDDNHAFLEIDTGYANGKILFVIKDSYANCFIPLLLPCYERIYAVDLRYFNGRLFQFMRQYQEKGDMDVLVLYNCIHFLEDFAYLK